MNLSAYLFVMEWIRIAEKLPNIGENVLVVVENKARKTRSGERHIRVGQMLTDRHIWIIGDNFGFNLGVVTHWMPLPEFPVSEEKYY